MNILYYDYDENEGSCMPIEKVIEIYEFLKKTFDEDIICLPKCLRLIEKVSLENLLQLRDMIDSAIILQKGEFL